MSRASSAPEMTSTRRPSAFAALPRSAFRFFTCRNAFVPTARAWPGGMSRMRSPIRASAASARPQVAGSMALFRIPAARRTGSFTRSTTSVFSPWTRATVRWKLRDPRSTAANRPIGRFRLEVMAGDGGSPGPDRPEGPRDARWGFP